MPDYRSPAYLAEAEENRRGNLDTLEFESKILGNKREIRVYLPAGYNDDDERAYPVLIVNDGLAWIDKGQMKNTLDSVIGPRAEAVVVVFLAPSPQWWLEAGGSNTDGYVQMLAEELVPFLGERYRLIDDPGARALMGNVFYGFSAAYGAFKYPDTFGKAAVQSVYLGLGAGDTLVEMIRTGDPGEIQLYVDWNRYESRNVDDGWNLREDGMKLAEELEGSGYTYAGGEVMDSFGWGSWRSRSDDILELLFPVE